MIKRVDLFLEKIAYYGLIVSISSMLFLTLLNITLRWFEVSIMWIDPLVRHLVFLAAFLGGCIAAGDDQHIKIDLLSRILQNKKSKKILDIILSFCSFLAAGFLFYAGVGLVQVEVEFGKPDFLGIHSSVLVGVIPFGACLMGLRFFLRILYIV